MTITQSYDSSEQSRNADGIKFCPNQSVDTDFFFSILGFLLVPALLLLSSDPSSHFHAYEESVFVLSHALPRVDLGSCRIIRGIQSQEADQARKIVRQDRYLQQWPWRTFCGSCHQPDFQP
jgi:hypothetical protein